MDGVRHMFMATEAQVRHGVAVVAAPPAAGVLIVLALRHTLVG